MQSITDFTNMNGFRTQDAVLEPKMSTLLGRKKWGVGIKISVWKRERMKKFLWWGRDAGMKTWVWVWGGGGGHGFSASFFEKVGCVCWYMGVFQKILRLEGVTIFIYFGVSWGVGFFIFDDLPHDYLI